MLKKESCMNKMTILYQSQLAGFQAFWIERVTRLYLIHGAFYDQNLHETHVLSDIIMTFQLSS